MRRMLEAEKTQRGFSLLGLLVVIAVAGLLSAWVLSELEAATVGAPRYDSIVAQDTITTAEISTQNVEVVVTDASQYGVQLTAFGNHADATNILTVTIDEAFDGSDWIVGTTTNAPWLLGTRSMSVTVSGTATVNVYSNFTLNAQRRLRFRTIAGDANGLSNVTYRLIGGRKPGI